MELLASTLGAHAKRRCHDYLSLMYRMLLAREPHEAIGHGLEEVRPVFFERRSCRPGPGIFRRKVWWC